MTKQRIPVYQEAEIEVDGSVFSTTIEIDLEIIRSFERSEHFGCPVSEEMVEVELDVCCFEATDENGNVIPPKSELGRKIRREVDKWAEENEPSIVCKYI